MFSKLPRWVEFGGFWLAGVAGAVNAIGLLGFKHQAVSHLTGTTTLFSLAVADLDLSEGTHLLLVLASFVCGATLSGLVVGNAALRLGRSYGVALCTEGLLLLLAMVALIGGSVVGHFLASAACGLQNGMVSTYSGAAVRTTHVSGLFTDLGIMLGARLRGHPLDRRKAQLFLLLIGGFVVGGTVGAVAFRHIQFAALGLPAGGAFVLAAVYAGFRRAGHPDHG